MSKVTRFANAPLVEVIAELRWNTASDAFFQQSMPGVSFQIPDAVVAENEAFYGRFAEAADDLGFRSIERLAPIGSPSIPGQVAMRFRRKANIPPILQVGPGVFTANGLPPTYTHWGEFRPLLRDGVVRMLATRPEAEQSLPFNASVRYVDSFGEDLWREEGRIAFIEKLSGFGLTLPPSVNEQLDSDREGTVLHQVSLPLANGATLQLQIGDGSAGDGTPNVLLAMEAQSPAVQPGVDAVMQVFESLHRVIRDTFFLLVQPIADRLHPVEVDEL